MAEEVALAQRHGVQVVTLGDSYLTSRDSSNRNSSECNV